MDAQKQEVKLAKLRREALRLCTRMKKRAAASSRQTLTKGIWDDREAPKWTLWLPSSLAVRALAENVQGSRNVH